MQRTYIESGKRFNSEQTPRGGKFQQHSKQFKANNMSRTPRKTTRNTETGADKGKTYLSKYSDELLITEIESRGYMVIEVPQIEIPDLNFDDIEFDNIDLSSLNEFEDKLRQIEANNYSANSNDKKCR